MRCSQALAFVATIGICAVRANAAATDCDGGCSSPGLVVSLSTLPSYTNIPRLELDAVVGDDVNVTSVSIQVQAGQLSGTFMATLVDGGSSSGGDAGSGPDGGGGSPDAGFGDAGSAGDAGFTGDAGSADGGSTQISLPGGIDLVGGLSAGDAGLSADAGVSADAGGADAGSGDAGSGDAGTQDGGVGSADGGTGGPPSIQFSTWHALVTLFEGANSVTAVATDARGASAGSYAQMVVLDSIPPDLHVVSPGLGQVFSTTTIQVNLQVTDATPTTVSVTSPGGSATITPDATGTVTTVANFPSAGASSLQIVATDSASNFTSLSVPVFIDTDAPLLTTALADGQQSGPLPGNAFGWAVSVADVAQTTVAFSPGGASTVVPRGGGPASASIPLVEGINHFTALATSESGHTASLQRSFTYDITPPTGAIEQPAANAAVRGIIELTAAAQDALTGVASVELGVDGPGAFAAPAGNLFIAAFDTHAIADGPHTAVARLTDLVGNQVTLRQPFTSDNTPPLVVLSSPAAGAYLGGSIAIAASAQDAVSGVTAVSVLVDGQPVGSCTASPCSVAYATTGHADGPATLTAQATDGAGNLGVSQAVSVIVDNSAPAGFLVSPSDGAVVGASMLVAVNVSDADFASVACSAGPIALGPSQSATFSATVDLSGVLDGPLTVACTARDLAGNVGTQAANVTVRKWRLEFEPEVLVLRALGGGFAHLQVSGPGAELLLPIAQRLHLAIPGGPPVAIVSATGRPGHATLAVQRAALVGSLRAGATAGSFSPPARVPLALVDGAVERGRDSVRVK